MKGFGAWFNTSTPITTQTWREEKAWKEAAIAARETERMPVEDRELVICCVCEEYFLADYPVNLNNEDILHWCSRNPSCCP